MNESATCREYVRPRLEAAGWDDDKHPIIEQKSFTDGRIVPISRDKIKRRKQKRANRLHRELNEAYKDYRNEARDILSALLDKYAEFGTDQFDIPEIFKVAPFSKYGNIREIMGLFGGAEKLREAVQQLQALLYAA